MILPPGLVTALTIEFRFGYNRGAVQTGKEDHATRQELLRNSRDGPDSRRDRGKLTRSESIIRTLGREI